MFDKKPPLTPDLVNADYAEIEKRMMADMARTFGVPSDKLGEDVNADYAEIEKRMIVAMSASAHSRSVRKTDLPYGTVTGRAASEPEPQSLKPTCSTCGHPVGYCGQC